MEKNEYFKIDKRVDRIIDNVSKYMVNLNHEYIRGQILKAYEYTKLAHEWQFRLSWEHYLVHPVKSTEILLSLKPDLYTIQACFLHDVIEDTPKTSDDIKEAFWNEVAFLCEWMEKISKVRYRWEERNIWSLRKMFIAMAEDLRVIFIKLADRLHNMQTLHHHPKPEKRKRIALETINIYAPIADRLWLFQLKNSLDQECFKILEYQEYKKLKKELKGLDSSIKAFTKDAKQKINTLLKWKINNYKIDFRVKSIYSIHKKMHKKSLTSANQLYDLFWLRIIVEDEADCYRVLWLIHNRWVPLPQRFKDYIALPKPNWYKSLHTNVMWMVSQQRKLPTEIQIKTYEMNEYADIWVAAHFEYKERWSQIATEINWVKELKETMMNIWDNDFVWSLKVDVFKDRIFVFTPKWDFINLPAGSTPIDFAYYVHTELGNHITLARVNDTVFPLDKELRNWDVVDIVVDKNKKPNPFWISFVKTVKAKNRIKSFLKKENKDLYIERWKDMLNKYLEKSWFDILDKDFSILKNLDWVTYNREERIKLLEQIGNFSTPPGVMIKKILKTKNNLHSKKILETRNIKYNVKKEKGKKKKNRKIIIWWENDLPYKIWKCCKDDLKDFNIVAHINSSGIISVHNRDCNVLVDANKKRLLSAYFEWNEDESIIFELELVFLNRIWVLKELSEILFSMWIDIDEISTNNIWKLETQIDLKLTVLNYDYLIIDRFIERLKLTFKTGLISSSIWKINK